MRHYDLVMMEKPPAESHDNPFLADGELSKKADTIISHSRITRTQLDVFDPDTAPPAPVEEQVAVVSSAPVSSAPPAGRPNQIGVRENGKVEEPLTPASIEVEVGKANATQAEPQTAEQVKVDSKPKCKCCVLM